MSRKKNKNQLHRNTPREPYYLVKRWQVCLEIAKALYRNFRNFDELMYMKQIFEEENLKP